MHTLPPSPSSRSLRVPVRLALVATLSAAAFLAPRPAGAGDALTQRHRDSTYKFSLSYPDSWDPVPLEGGEAPIVCKFTQRDAEAKGVAAARLSVLYTGPAPGEGETTPGEDDGDLGAQGGSTDLVETMNGMLGEIGYEGRIQRAAGKAIKSKDGVAGRVWTLDAKYEDQTVFHVLAVWEKEKRGAQAGMWLRCMGAQRKRNEALFLAMVASFQWFDSKATATASLDVLKDLPLRPAKRRQIERGLVKGWNVIVSPKKNYVVVYNTLGKRNDLLAKMVAEKIEKIREQLYEAQFPPLHKVEAVSVVRICGSRAEYRAYGAPSGSAGYWSPDAEELVFYDASPKRKLDEDTLAVCFHEAFHQYIHYSTGEVAPHSWFDEGHGDYYAGARSAGGKFQIRPFDWRVGTVKTAIRTGPSPKTPDGRYDRTKGGYTPLEDLVRFSQDEYYDYPTVSYAQGWSLVYFLREIVPKKPAWQAKWGSILTTYFSTLRGTATLATPEAKAPGKADADDEDDEADEGDADPPAPAAGMEGSQPAPEPGPDDGDGEDGAPSDGSSGVAPRRFVGEGGGDLPKALEKAFQGVDWKEFEEAWKTSVLSIPG